MRKIYIGEDNKTQKQREEELNKKPQNIQDLRERVGNMAIMADVAQRSPYSAKVTVTHNTGTMHFYSSAGSDLAYLNAYASKKQEKEYASIYLFHFDEVQKDG